MLWYKSWLETRWRFLIGFSVLTILACGIVLQYPAVRGLMPLADSIGASHDGGIVGRAIRNAVAIQRDYRGFVWYQWVRQNLAQTWTLFAALLGAGGLVGGASGGGALFTLSLPVRRSELVRTRVLLGLAELYTLALVPTLLVTALSPAIGEHYGAGEALLYGTCVFVGGAMFYSLAMLLSTLFTDIWRPALLTCAAAIVTALAETLVRDGTRYGIWGAITAESYFKSGALPWPGLLVSIAASLSMLYATVLNVESLEV